MKGKQMMSASGASRALGSFPKYTGNLRANSGMKKGTMKGAPASSALGPARAPKVSFFGKKKPEATR